MGVQETMVNKLHKILLATATARGWAKAIGTSAKDAQVINGLFEVAVNPQMGTKSVYVSKRPGSSNNITITGTTEIKILKLYSDAWNSLFIDSSGDLITAANENCGSVGQMDERSNLVLAEAIIAAVPVIAFVAGGDGWFLYQDALSNNYPDFDGDRTSGSAVIDGITDTTGIYKGQAISGTGIPAGTRVLSVDSATQITMDANATSGSATETTITKEAVAKITDSHFPTQNLSTPQSPVNMEFLDGYFIVGDFYSGKIYNSDINDPSSWSASSFLTADYSGDRLNCIFKIGDHIVGAGALGTIQPFNNAGNSSGSILSAAEHLVILGTTILSRPVRTNSGLYFIGDTGNSTAPAYGLYRMPSIGSIEKVSDSVWDGIITDGGYDAISTAIMGGREVLILQADFSTGATTLPIYDPTTKMFSMYSGPQLISSFKETFTVNSSLVSRVWATGNTWTDSSSAYTLTIQTEPQIMAGGLSTTDVWADLTADTEASGTASLDTSDDDYANWVSKGTFDMTAQKKRIWALGWHEAARAYRIQHSANTGFRMQLLTVNHSPSST